MSQPACMRWARRQVDPDRPGVAKIEEWQRGQCAVCGRRYPEDLELDHSHRTGLIRGYLCRKCNRYENHAAFLSYVAGMNPAALLGVADVYLNPWGGLPVFAAASREIASAAFLLAGLDFDALPAVVRLDGTEGELQAARDLLWNAEGWPAP